MIKEKLNLWKTNQNKKQNDGEAAFLAVAFNCSRRLSFIKHNQHCSGLSLANPAPIMASTFDCRRIRYNLQAGGIGRRDYPDWRWNDIPVKQLRFCYHRFRG